MKKPRQSRGAFCCAGRIFCVTKKRKLQRGRPEEEAAVLMQAMKEYFKRGRQTTKCDKCGGTIEFRELSQFVWEHTCPCGRYKGTLHGLH